MQLANYFNRRSLPGFVAKRYAALRHRGKQFVESAEANEAQDIAYERLGEVGDGAFGAISLREGGTLIVDQAAGTVRLSESRVWAGGYMHRVPAATLVGVPMVGSVAIGVAVTDVAVTDVDDPELKGIVPDTASHGEPLAARLRYDAVWALDGDPFYPIFTLVDGQLPNEVTPPQDSAAEMTVERHVREDHGSHVVDGFQVSAGGYDAATGEQTYVIGAGVLRAEGRRVSRTVDQRYRRVENPTLVEVNGETHLYPDGGVVTLNNGPIDSVQTVTVIKEVTKSVTHQLAGGSDALPDTPVYAIMSVAQGGNTYAANADYRLTADKVDWSPNGAEPSAGSTYSVTYRYIETVIPQAIGRSTIALEAAVVGQPVTASYRWKLPRIDIIAIDLDGAVVYIEGVSSRYNPAPPRVPAPLAPLVRISNRWGIEPNIEDVDQRKLTEADVRAMLRTLLDFGDLLSQIALERDIQERDPASRRGSFVDPFLDDLQRDLGIAQNAAIADGILQLPVDFTPIFADLGSEAITLPYVSEALMSQPYRTASQIINEFQAFAPLPSPLTIDPAVDRWNITQSSTRSSSSSSVKRVNSYRPDLLGTSLYGTTSRSTSRSVSTRLASRSVEDLEFLRAIEIAFNVTFFGPGEELQSVTFDGLDVTESVTGTRVANANGEMSGTFTIPENVKAGTKAVVVTGKGGSRGETSFTGQGTLTTEVYVRRVHTTTTYTTIDPIAQSFLMPAMRQITGVRVEFAGKGDAGKPVAIELRDMDGSTPGTEILAAGRITGDFALGDPQTDRETNWTLLPFEYPVLVDAGEWRAFALLTDDADHAVAIARLGDQSGDAPTGFDPRRQEWVRENPAGGDLFKGSNGKTWLAMPDADMTHQIMVARYTATSRTFVIGSYDLSEIDAAGISDLVVLLIYEEPTVETKVTIELVRETGEIVAFEPNTRLELDDYLTEEVTLRMVLTGTETLSPVVMPECQILFGRLAETASYISEAIALDQTHGDLKVRSVLEVSAPGTSSVAVAVGDDEAWSEQADPASVSLGDGWIEREYLDGPVSAPELRERITLTGTPRYRPLVRNLRVRATEV